MHIKDINALEVVEAPVGFTKFDGPSALQYSKYASDKLQKDYWVVTRGFVYHHGEVGSNRITYVPEGYLTDIASVPRIFWSLVPPDGGYGQAAVLHDYLCEYLQYWVAGEIRHITRKETDDVLMEAMIALGVPSWKRSMIYRAVCVYRQVFNVWEPSYDPEKALIEDRLRGYKKEKGYFP